MKKLTTYASTAMLIAAAAFSAEPAVAAPHGPRPGQQQQFVMNWCQTHRGDPSCNDFHRRGNHWSNSDYHNWYMRHRHDNGFSPLAAGIFGMAAGAIIGGAAAAASNSNHVAACQRAYRSYDTRSDTYLGYDGARHRCTL